MSIVSYELQLVIGYFSVILPGAPAMIFSTIARPSTPALFAIVSHGTRIARETISTPICSSLFLVSRLRRCGTHRRSATPPPGTIPSSTAARVAQRAS